LLVGAYKPLQVWGKGPLKQKEWKATHEDPLKQKRRERMEQEIDTKFNTFMDNIGEDGWEGSLKALDRMLELVEQKSVLARRKEDGTYELIKPDKST